MSRLAFVDLRAQWRELAGELRPAIEAVFADGAFVGGPAVQRFETAFAAFCAVRHAVGVANGTDALHLALRALGVGAGDDVLTVPNTFIATAEAISHCGARPVFVDCDPDTLLLDARQLDGAVTPRTRAVVAVHLYGRVAEMDAIAAWCAARGLPLVEDAAQAHGAGHRGRRAGGLGAIAGFSFYPGKNLGAGGEAGAVTTDRDDLAERVRRLRDHGQEARYHHAEVGWNSRLDAVQAAVLTVKLRHLPRWNARRRVLADLYRERLGKLAAITVPAAPVEADAHVYHLFVIRAAARDRLRAALAEAGIETGLHYPVPIHLQAAYRALGLGPGTFPVAEAAARTVLSLPIHPHMTDDDVHRVCDAVERVA